MLQSTDLSDQVSSVPDQIRSDQADQISFCGGLSKHVRPNRGLGWADQSDQIRSEADQIRSDQSDQISFTH